MGKNDTRTPHERRADRKKLYEIMQQAGQQYDSVEDVQGLFKDMVVMALENGLEGEHWQSDLEQANAFTKTPAGKRLYAWRKQTNERSFADTKQLHAFRYARMLGIANMREQAFLPAAIQNMKKMVSLLWKPLYSLLLRFLFTQQSPSFA